MYFVFSHSFSVFLVLLVFFVFFSFLVASFDELRPLLVASHCSFRSLANKFCSFVRSEFTTSLQQTI